MADVTIDLAPILKRRVESARKTINNPPLSLIKACARSVQKECIRAFDRQALGDIKWPARYEGMSSPFINIAGALADWISGRTDPKPNRFQDRPALIDEGNRGGLKGSITSNTFVGVINPLTVFLGTDKQYASIHQDGGVSIQNYDDSTANRIRNWLFPKTKTERPSKKSVSHHGRSGKEAKQKNPREDYIKHIGFLLFQKRYVQNVTARPFIGVTDYAQNEMTKIIEKFFNKEIPHGSAS